MVNSQGTWTSATSRHKNKIENPTLVQQEQIKNRKHDDFRLLDLLYLTSSFPVLDLMGLLQFVVFSPLLI